MYSFNSLSDDQESTLISLEHASHYIFSEFDHIVTVIFIKKMMFQMKECQINMTKNPSNQDFPIFFFDANEIKTELAIQFKQSN